MIELYYRDTPPIFPPSSKNMMNRSAPPSKGPGPAAALISSAWESAAKLIMLHTKKKTLDTIWKKYGEKNMEQLHVHKF